MPVAPTWAESEAIPSWEDSEPLADDRPPRGETPADFTQPPPRPEVAAPAEDFTSTERTFPDTRRPFATTPEEFDARFESDRKRAELQQDLAMERIGGELIGRTTRMFEPNLPRNLLAPTTEEFLSEGDKFRASMPAEMRPWQQSPFRPPTTAAELSPETREGLAAGQAASGTLADLSSADQALILGGAALSGGIPGAAGRILHGAIPATFGVEGVKSIYEGAKTLLSPDATPEERGQAKVQVGMGATMLPGLGGLVKRPVIAERVIAKTEAAVPGALNKAKAALAETARRGAEIVELPSLAPDAFKAGDAVDFSDAGAQLRGKIVSTGLDFVIVEDVNGNRTRVSGRHTIPVTKVSDRFQQLETAIEKGIPDAKPNERTGDIVKIDSGVEGKTPGTVSETTRQLPAREGAGVGKEESSTTTPTNAGTTPQNVSGEAVPTPGDVSTERGLRVEKRRNSTTRTKLTS